MHSDWGSHSNFTLGRLQITLEFINVAKRMPDLTAELAALHCEDKASEVQYAKFLNVNPL